MSLTVSSQDAQTGTQRSRRFQVEATSEFGFLNPHGAD